MFWFFGCERFGLGRGTNNLPPGGRPKGATVYDITKPLPVQRQEIFVQKVVHGTDPKEAFREAGYKAKGATTFGLMRRKHVADRIEYLMNQRIERERRITEEVVKKTALSKEYVINRLMENVERSMQAEPVFDKKGNPTGEYRYEGSVANKALELLGREVGLFIEKKEIGQPGEFAAIDDPNKLRELILRRLVMAEPRLVASGAVGIEGSMREDAD